MLFNRKRAADYLKEYDLEAVVATTTFNVAYLTDFDCWQYRDFRENMAIPGASNTLLQTYAVYIPDKDPILVTSTGSVQFTDELSGIERRTYGGMGMKLPTKKSGESKNLSLLREAVKSAEATPQEALVAALQDHDIKKGKVGIEFSNLARPARKHIQKKMDRVEWLDAPEFIRLIRMVKTPEEVSRMKTAAQITEKGLNKSLEAAHEGAAMGEMSQAYLSEVARHGAVPDHYIFAAHGLGISSSPHYKLHAGDFNMIDCGVIYKQYYSDTGTTFVIGGNPAVEKTYHALWEIFESHLDLLAPGKKPSAILKAFSKSYEKHKMKVGYQGHAIGLQTREHPVINRSDYKRIADDIVDISIDIPLEEGMIINIETPMDVLGKGAYQLERTFRITKDKPEELTPKRENVPHVIKEAAA